MEYPLVSFLSPCFNHSDYIIESLDSIRLQTYPNIEHIIIDDCSTDDSVIKIKDWIKKNNYKCVFIQHKKNRGISCTLNEGIKLATGEFWTALATDDLAYSERTEVFVKHLLENPQMNMITSDCDVINKFSAKAANHKSYFLDHFYRYNPGKTLQDFGTFETLLKGNYIPSSIFIRKSVFRKTGFFNEDLKMEDWDMWLRISKISRIGFVSEMLTSYRLHENNTLKNIDPTNDFHLSLIRQAKYSLPKIDYKEYWDNYERVFNYNILNYPNNKYLFKYTPSKILLSVILKKAFDKVKKVFS